MELSLADPGADRERNMRHSDRGALRTNIGSHWTGARPPNLCASIRSLLASPLYGLPTILPQSCR